MSTENLSTKFTKWLQNQYSSPSISTSTSTTITTSGTNSHTVASKTTVGINYDSSEQQNDRLKFHNDRNVFKLPSVAKIAENFVQTSLENEPSIQCGGGGNRRNSFSLPSSPQTSPKLARKKYAVNKYFASPFVENEDLPQYSGWLRSTLFAVRDKNYYSIDDLRKDAAASNGSIKDLERSALYRELNLCSPTSM